MAEEVAMLDLETTFGRRADERPRTETVCWLATNRPDGSPVLVPVLFLWDGSTIVLFSQPGSSPPLPVSLRAHG
jgi:hypothetical protein